MLRIGHIKYIILVLFSVEYMLQTIRKLSLFVLFRVGVIQRHNFFEMGFLL